MLRDAAGLARGHVRGADGVEQGSLAVIDVAHDGDDGRARLLDVLFEVLLVAEELGDLLVGDHLLEALELHVEAEAAADLLRHVVVERLVERGEDAALQEEGLDVLRADAGLLGELLDGGAFDEVDLLHGRRAGLDVQ